MQNLSLWVLYGGLTLSALELLFSWLKGSATEGQMRRRGIQEGLPLLWHGAFYGNIVLTILFSVITKLYGSQWTTSNWLVHVTGLQGTWLGFNDWIYAFVVAAIISTGMRILYSKSTLVEAHNEDGPTAAGWVQTVSMTGGFTIGFLYFFPSTQHPDPGLMWLTTYLLAVYFAVANHFVPGIIKLWTKNLRLQFYPAKPLESWIGWVSVLAPGVGMLIAATLRVRR
jgi:hypothetical protein